MLQGLDPLRDRRARQISLYILLVGFVATAFEAAQTELVGEELDRAWEQQTFLANVGFWGNALVLFLQVFWTGRIMTRSRASLLLVALPVISIVGLGCYWLLPTAAAIFVIQVGRRGVNYAVEKPAGRCSTHRSTSPPSTRSSSCSTPSPTAWATCSAR